MVRDSLGQTVLHHAVKSGSKEIVKYIIENGELNVAVVLPLAKEPGSRKSPHVCSEGVLLVLEPFPLGLLHHSGMWAFPGICQYWGVPVAVAALWQGPASLWVNICQCPAFRETDWLFLAAPTEIWAALFRHFSVMSSQNPFFSGRSWAQMPLLA